jgi:hypothetical protein
MKDFLAVFLTILLFSLWFIPVFIELHFNDDRNWGSLYVPLFIITLFWGDIIKKEYFNN